jgi:hypothetical protein
MQGVNKQTAARAQIMMKDFDSTPILPETGIPQIDRPANRTNAELRMPGDLLGATDVPYWVCCGPYDSMVFSCDCPDFMKRDVTFVAHIGST